MTKTEGLLRGSGIKSVFKPWIGLKKTENHDIL